MAYRSDFFTAKEIGGVYDRRYGADTFARRFASFISSGIEIIGGGVLSDELAVSIIPASMQSQVNIGAVSIQGRRGEVYEAPEVLTHSGADPLNPRIDRVVMELNLTDDVRAIVPKIITGTPAEYPEPEPLVRTSSIYQLCLATILIPADVASIPAENVTDTRADAEVCGIANIVLGIKPPDGNSAALITVDDSSFDEISGQDQQTVNESVDQVLKSHKAENALYQYKKDVTVVDANGNPTEVEYKRKSDNTLAIKRNASNPDTNGYYQTVVEQFYESDGTTVYKTATYTFTYLDNGIIDTSDGGVISQ